jgi:hypothetical protein
MLKVIKAFTDLEHHHVYAVGDTFPRNGVCVTEERIKELSGKKNRMGVPLIKEVEEKPKQAKRKNNE